MNTTTNRTFVLRIPEICIFSFTHMNNAITGRTNVIFEIGNSLNDLYVTGPT